MDVKIILEIHPQQKQVNIYHQVFSATTISTFKSKENKHDVYRGKDTMKKFCKFLREHAEWKMEKFVTSVKKKIEDKHGKDQKLL